MATGTAWERIIAWVCNNCGHGESNRPDRVCNCNCHEAFDAGRAAGYAEGLEDAAVKAYDMLNIMPKTAAETCAAIRKLKDGQ